VNAKNQCTHEESMENKSAPPTYTYRQRRKGPGVPPLKPGRCGPELEKTESLSRDVPEM